MNIFQKSEQYNKEYSQMFAQKEFNSFSFFDIIDKGDDNMYCIFCKIIKGEIPSYTLYEDELLKIFLDINPDSNGHLLIIPKKHIVNIDDMDNNTLIHIMNLAKKYKLILEEKLNIDGLTLVQNNGMIQEVKHYHLHLKPYYEKDDKLLPVEDIFKKLNK